MENGKVSPNMHVISNKSFKSIVTVYLLESNGRYNMATYLDKAFVCVPPLATDGPGQRGPEGVDEVVQHPGHHQIVVQGEDGINDHHSDTKT